MFAGKKAPEPCCPVVEIPCPACDGAGEIHVLDHSPMARESWEWSGTCHECEGRGEVLALDLGELGFEVLGPVRPLGLRKTA